MDMESRKLTGDLGLMKIQAFAVIFVAVIAAAVILHITRSFMVPFALAVLLSFLIIPVANWMDRRRIPSVLGNIFIIIGIIVVISLLGLLMYGSFASIRSTLPTYTVKIRYTVETAVHFVENNFGLDLSGNRDEFSIRSLFTLLSPSSYMNLLNQSIGTFVTFFTKMGLTLLFLLFIFTARKALVKKTFDIAGARSDDDAASQMIFSIGRDIQSYLWLKTIISICTGFAFGLAAFVMGLDFYLVWGFIGFMLNYIPSIGPVMASIPPILLAFLQFDSIGWAAATSVLMAGVQFASGSIIEPKIMGDRLNLNIIAILLSLFLWGIIWGIPGMLLSVPITAALNILLRNIPRFKRISMLLSK